MLSTARTSRLYRFQKNFCRLVRARLSTSWRLLLALPLFITLAALHSALNSQRPLLLWSTPRTGGFNNQLITIYQAIACARRHHRTLVLPLIYENVRRDTSSKGQGPFPFEDYFDLEALKKVVHLTTPAHLDIHGVPCRRIAFSTSSHFMANARRIPRLLKQNYTSRFPLVPHFVERQSFPGGEPCVDDSFCTGDEWLDFGPYSDYNISGQGFNVRASAPLLHIRSAFKPSASVRAIANAWLETMPKPFNALHLRKGDFTLKCKELPHLCIEYGEFSFVQTGPFIHRKIAQLHQPSLPLFISTTHANECRENLRGTDLKLFFMEDFKLPSELKWAENRVDILSFASQVVASQAAQFIGNRFSSFTTEVNNMRYLRNQSDELIFF